ncbi:MAG: coiled-coil domain-containing protein 85 [Desmonostoc vinosum HA7617-LM4]|jgi:hypothetical protein|nr:coiled-coil domain-containing protein 85 [Desmonostoc vinosum HA7617-LM4]
MLTLNREKISASLFTELNSSIKETFTAIDHFEWQAVDEILQMRSQQLYREAGYKSFEQYCQRELSAWGGYRRINTERTYPKEYALAVAQLKQQHQQELERLEQDLRIGLFSEATAQAQQQVQEQLTALQQLFQQQKQENIQLQHRLFELEGLRQLELENQRLQKRIQELERAVEERPAQEWSNTYTKQATKALNKQVKQALDQTIDLRSLAQEPPKENAQECLRLMGIALGNLANTMNNTKALEAAAIILGSEPTQSAIAYRAEQLQLLPQAVSDIRVVLSKPECSWWDYLEVATEYEVIKNDYWAELTTEEKELIAALEKTASSETEEPLVPDETPAESACSNEIRLGSIVAHADIYCALYPKRGEVIEDLGSEVWVAWEHWKNRPKKTDRYFKTDLRLL